MSKLRLRHLLKEKAIRECREITMTDFSNEAEISFSEINKITTDASYDPPTVILDKMAKYFGCPLGDIIDQTTKIEFDLASTFPPGDELATDVICLLAAANDITFLQGLYLSFRAEPNLGEKQRNEQVFALKLAIGFLREGLIVFKHLLSNKRAKELLCKLDGDGKRAYESVKQDCDAEKSLYNTYLKNLRNDAIFHYQRSPYSKALRSIKQPKGHLLVGLTPGETRFFVADDIRSEIIRSHINFDSPDENERQKMGRIIETMGNFMRFASSFLITYLEHRKIVYNEV